MSKWSRAKAEKALGKRSPADGISEPPKKAGRPRIVIDLAQVKALASIQCTYEEIAAVLGISKVTFVDRVNTDPALRAIIDQAWANGRASFRRLQVKLLEAGNATMGIWLGKQYLGQRDQIGITGGDGGAIKTQDVDPYESLRAELSRIAERERAAADSQKL